MQGKNQLLNIIEQQSCSAVMRLLMSNKHFHEDKEGTEESNAQDYIELTVRKMNLKPEDIDYPFLKKSIYNRHT